MNANSILGMMYHSRIQEGEIEQLKRLGKDGVQETRTEQALSQAAKNQRHGTKAGGVDQHDTFHTVGVFEGERRGDHPAEAVAHQRSAGDLEIVEESMDLLDIEFEAVALVATTALTTAEEVDADHPMSVGEGGRNVDEVRETAGEPMNKELLYKYKSR